MASKYPEIEVADIAPCWRLFRRDGAESNGWYSFVLRPLTAQGAPRRTRTRAWSKRGYFAGHNGTRFANGHDMQVLRKYHPDIHETASGIAARHVAERMLA